MVNSPSRPILRPDAPPTPVECGGRTPLWNRETCLPAHRMPVRNQTKSNHQASASRHLPLCMFFAVAPPLPSRSPNSETRTRFFPIKAKTPLIVHNQGISRQTPNSRSAPVPGTATPEPVGRVAMPIPLHPTTPYRSPKPGIRSRFPQSRQKPLQSCLIKAHQGIRPKNTCHSNLLQSSAIGRRSFPLPSPLRLCVFALKNHQSSHRKAQSRQKPQQSRLIVHNQGKRQFFQRMLKIGCSDPAHPPAVI